MSHKTKIKTQLNNKGYLCDALNKLGFSYKVAEEGQKLSTQNRFSNKEKADVDVLITGRNNKSYKDAIGFVEEQDGTFSVIGDDYDLDITEEYLKQEVTASAKEAEINENLMKLGFENIATEETNNYIELTLERWVN